MILFLVVMDGAAFEFFSHLVQVELRRTINYGVGCSYTGTGGTSGTMSFCDTP